VGVAVAQLLGQRPPIQQLQEAPQEVVLGNPRFVYSVDVKAFLHILTASHVSFPHSINLLLKIVS